MPVNGDRVGRAGEDDSLRERRNPVIYRNIALEVASEPLTPALQYEDERLLRILAEDVVDSWRNPRVGLPRRVETPADLEQLSKWFEEKKLVEKGSLLAGDINRVIEAEDILPGALSSLALKVHEAEQYLLRQGRGTSISDSHINSINEKLQYLHELRGALVREILLFSTPPEVLQKIVDEAKKALSWFDKKTNVPVASLYNVAQTLRNNVYLIVHSDKLPEGYGNLPAIAFENIILGSVNIPNGFFQRLFARRFKRRLRHNLEKFLKRACELNEQACDSAE